MTTEERDGYTYGESQDDIPIELTQYGLDNGYPTDRFADCICDCGSRVFLLDLDEDEGVSQRICVDCKSEHIMADGQQYRDAAHLERCECLCGESHFEITVAVNLYRDEQDQLSQDVRWFYIGCRCPACGLLGCYGDWKNEYSGVDSFLASV